MADTDLPITGKDVQARIIVGGQLRAVAHIVRWEEKPVYDEVVTKALGTDGSQIDMPFTHWEGSLEIAENTADLDEVIDVINNARKLRIPVRVDLFRTYFYRDGTTRSYVYPDCKVGFDNRASRGEAVSKTIPWKCGQHRIAA